MFKSFFKKQEEKKESSEFNATIAMIMLDDIIDLSAEKFLKNYNESHTDIKNVEVKENSILFEIDDEIGFISLMPAPIPWKELEGPCATAWHWKEATQVLKQHKAHLLVSVLPKNQQKSILDRVITTTNLVVSVLQSTDSLGAYWGTGTVVQSKEYFIKRAANMNTQDLPYELWMEFRIEVHPDKRCNIITTGLKAFGHMEIEIIKSIKDPMTVLGFILKIVDYLIKNGPVIKDGDTVGEDANQKIRVTYKKSIWDRPGNVMNINF
jgi:hypothetical protein